MSDVPTITLSGPGAAGVSVAEDHAALIRALSPTVRLGCLPPRPLMARYLVWLDDHFEPSRAPAPPASTNWRAAAAVPLARMYCNDRLGCCVMAGKAHNLGVWSANDPDSGGTVEATDDEIESQYRSVCGPNDQGCVITDVLGYLMRTGFQASGQRYRLDGYCAVDHTNQLLVKTLQAIGGAASIGINLPADWTRSDVWDVTSSKILGGHDVSVLDFDATGVYVSSWGRIYLVTWRAFLSTRWVREYYYQLSPLWYGPDEMAPSGFDAAQLKQALEVFRRGGIPDYPAPDGPSPGPAPAEVGKLFDLDFTAMNGRRKGEWFQVQAKADVPAGKCSLVYPALPDATSVALPREAP